MSERDEVKEILIKFADTVQVMFATKSVVDDATDRIMEVFKPATTATPFTALDYDLGPARDEACC